MKNRKEIQEKIKMKCRYYVEEKGLLCFHLGKYSKRKVF